jgi:hypothetical protein
MPDTCLAKGCNVKVPKWTKLCSDHMWMASVESRVEAAMDDLYRGYTTHAMSYLQQAIDRIREAQDG